MLEDPAIAQAPLSQAARLAALELRSAWRVRDAFKRLSPLALLWPISAAGNTLLWITRKAFGGYVPFPVIHVDPGTDCPAAYALRDRLAGEWRLHLYRCRAGQPIGDAEALNGVILCGHLDEAATPAAADAPVGLPHGSVRTAVMPLLDWRFGDLCGYVAREGVPVLSHPGPPRSSEPHLGIIGPAPD